MIDGSPELSYVLLRLHRWHGREPFDYGQACAAVLTIAAPSPNGVSLPRYLALWIEALVRGRYLDPVPASDRTFVLSDRAVAYATAEDEQASRELEAVALTPSLLFRDGAVIVGPALPAPRDADLSEVTRAFLVEALREAELPDDLVETILATYAAHGRLEMSEDGGRYHIHLRG